MGTLFTLTLYAADATVATNAATAAFARVAALNRAMTDYDPESELMRLCAQPAGTPVRVSADLFAVLQRARELSVLTGGAFDPTIGPLIRHWRRTRRTGELPSEEALHKAAEPVGWRYLQLDPRQRTVTLRATNLQLDLGGIAKGFAADAALETLRRSGVPRALVAASGDIAAGEAPPGQRGWRVAIGAGTGPDAQLEKQLLLRQAAVSTSGDVEQSVEIAGIRYSHIVDPRTGVGLTNRTQATVIARRATDTDGLATAMCVLGAEAGLDLVERLPGVAALVISGEGEARKLRTSRRFASVPQEN